MTPDIGGFSSWSLSFMGLSPRREANHHGRSEWKKQVSPYGQKAKEKWRNGAGFPHLLRGHVLNLLPLQLTPKGSAIAQ